MTTETHKIAPSAYARHLMRIWTVRHWWLVAVLPAIALTLVFVIDWRFLFVAVILVFLVIPHIMVTVYYYHAMSPKAAMSILPHRVIFESDALRIVYDTEPEGQDEDTNSESNTEQIKRQDDIIPYSDISSITRNKSDILLHLSSGEYNILVIPSAQWPEGVELPLHSTS
ncbi:MAG: hypothetical protein NC127_03460 [Muribaculum sp.]|nr:hypothetical protein [Muribaculum sp.]